MYFQGQQPGFLPPSGGPGARGMPFPPNPMMVPPPVTGGRGPWPGQQQGMPPPAGGPSRSGPQQPNMPPMYGQPLQNNAFYMAQAQAAAAARGAAGRGGGPVPGMPGPPPNMAMPMGGRPAASPANQRPGPSSGGPRGSARPHMPTGPLPGQEGAIPAALTSQTLSAAPPTQQKQLLGEALYPKIHEMNPGLAGKITGMLLEMSNEELLAL